MQETNNIKEEEINSLNLNLANEKKSKNIIEIEALKQLNEIKVLNESVTHFENISKKLTLDITNKQEEIDNLSRTLSSVNEEIINIKTKHISDVNEKQSSSDTISKDMKKIIEEKQSEIERQSKNYYSIRK